MLARRELGAGVDIIGEWTIECGDEERDEVTLPAIAHVGANDERASDDGDLGSWLLSLDFIHPALGGIHDAQSSYVLVIQTRYEA